MEENFEENLYTKVVKSCPTNHKPQNKRWRTLGEKVLLLSQRVPDIVKWFAKFKSVGYFINSNVKVSKHWKRHNKNSLKWASGTN